MTTYIIAAIIGLIFFKFVLHISFWKSFGYGMLVLFIVGGVITSGNYLVAAANQSEVDHVSGLVILGVTCLALWLLIRLVGKDSKNKLQKSAGNETTVSMSKNDSQDEDNYVFCHQCGLRSSENDIFCRKCGTKLKSL